MKPNLTFVERNWEQNVIFWENPDISDYDKVRQFKASVSEVRFFMEAPIEDVKKQIKKILEVETNK